MADRILTPEYIMTLVESVRKEDKDWKHNKNRFEELIEEYGKQVNSDIPDVSLDELKLYYEKKKNRSK